MQALIDYINSDFDLSVYWKTLNDNGITKERLLSYDRAIRSEPDFRRDQKEGLLRDLGHYMRTLKVGALLRSYTPYCNSDIDCLECNVCIVLSISSQK